MLKLPKVRIAIMMLILVFLIGCGDTSKDNSVEKAGPAATVTAAENNAQGKAAQEDSHNKGSGLKIKPENIVLVKKPQKTKYLLTNGIEIKRIEKFIGTSKGDMQFSIIQIDGLVDKVLESKLNKAIEKDLKEAAINYVIELKDLPHLYCEVELNANNLLSISIYDMYSPPLQGFLYRLTDGKRLYLEDIFTEGTNYVSLINRKVLEAMASEGLEEDSLREPFSTIKSNQSFLLSKGSLHIIFVEGEGGFGRRKAVTVPLSTVDDYIDVTDRYSGTERKNHEKTYLIVRENNIFADQKGKIIKNSKGNLWSYYPEVSGIRDDAFEEVINGKIRAGIDEVVNSKIVNSLLQSSQEEHNSIATIQMNVQFNQYGFLTIKRYAYSNNNNKDLRSFEKVYTFDLKEKKIVEGIEILQNYLAKNKADEDTFVKLVKENLKEYYSPQYTNLSAEVDSKVDYSFIKKKGSVYFSKAGTEEGYIHVLFSENAFQGISVPLDCQVTFDSIVKVAPEDFFGWY